MDQTENRSLHTVEKFQNHHFLRRTLQFTLSVFIFSLILFYSSGCVIFANLCNFYYSRVLFSFFTHTLERKYMFLLCNGILAFLAKSISFSPPPESFSDLHDGVDENPSSETKLENYEASVDMETVDTLQDDNVAPGADEEIKEESEKEDEGEGDGDDEPEVVEEQNAEELPNEEGEEEEEEEEEEISGSMQNDLLGSQVAASREDLLSAEELNKKFEEFIRKMKEEIRIEAQSQLIAV